MGFNVCVAGATGNVGRTIIKIIEERNFPVDRIRFLASSRSKGKKLPFRGTDIVVEELTLDSFEKGEPDIEIISDIILKYKLIEDNINIDNLEKAVRSSIVKRLMSVDRVNLEHHVKFLKALKKISFNRCNPI